MGGGKKGRRVGDKGNFSGARDAKEALRKRWSCPFLLC